jgi:hypothetical protein
MTEVDLQLVDPPEDEKVRLRLVELIFGNTTIAGMIGVVMLSGAAIAAMPSATKEIVATAIPVVAALAGGPMLKKLSR